MLTNIDKDTDTYVCICELSIINEIKLHSYLK